MYGLIIQNLQSFLLNEFGEDLYNSIRKVAGITEYSYSVHKKYSDDIIMKMVDAAVEVTGWTKDQILHGMGLRFPRVCGEYGYYKMLKTVGRNLKEFVNGLDHMHDSLRFSYPGMRTPSFYCDEETEDGLRLNYRSKRKGYVNYVCGQLEEMASYVFDMQITARVEELTESEEGTHAVIRLSFFNEVQSRKVSTGVSHLCPTISTEVILGMFPFHMLFREDMKMFGIGESLLKVLPDSSGKLLRECFYLLRPAIPFTWRSILEHPHCVFELVSTHPIVNGKTIFNDVQKEPRYLHLKGQMKYVESWEALIYLASPVLENLDHMFNIGLFLNDLSLHDASRDLVLVGNHKSAELKIALDQEVQKSAMLEESMKKLDNEMQKTDKLLYSMIPRTVADRLRSGDLAVNTCENFESATILFSDVVGFTAICSRISPMQVVEMLNSLYTTFDTLSEKHQVYKVETIGDAYMVVSGVPERIINHGERIAEMAFAMLSSVVDIKDPSDTTDYIKIRIGIHSGSVVAGVIGIKMPRYCLFGDTVNTASRMETNSIAMSIHISETTKKEIEGKGYVIRRRGSISVKGKGRMHTYWLLGKGNISSAISLLSLTSIEQSIGIMESMIQEETDAVIEEAQGNVSETSGRAVKMKDHGEEESAGKAKDQETNGRIDGDKDNSNNIGFPYDSMKSGDDNDKSAKNSDDNKADNDNSNDYSNGSSNNNDDNKNNDRHCHSVKRDNNIDGSANSMNNNSNASNNNNDNNIKKRSLQSTKRNNRHLVEDAGSHSLDIASSVKSRETAKDKLLPQEHEQQAKQQRIGVQKKRTMDNLSTSSNETALYLQLNGSNPSPLQKGSHPAESKRNVTRSRTCNLL